MSGSDARQSEFEELAMPHVTRLYGTALRWIRRPEDASDLVQETFLRAYRTFDGFRPGSNARAWLYTILYSVFVNRYHGEGRRPPTVPIEDIEDAAAVPEPDAGQELALLRELDPWVGSEEARAALDRLPDVYRAAVEMVDLEELSYEEAAAAAGCPVGTLRSRLFRGRKLLAADLTEYARRVGYLREKTR